MYNRLFTKILDSSIWLQSSATRIVWVTLIAAMDEDGYAHFSAIENLAARARVSVKETQKAVDCFLAPDPTSSNPANEGRRIERVPGGFVILNGPDHRKMFNREGEREQVRLRVAKHRLKSDVTVNDVTELLPNVTPVYVSENASEDGKRIVKEKPIVFPLILDTEAFHAAWANWEQHRREIKKPLTPTSIKQQLKDLADFGEERAISAILFTIRKGWQGLREDDSTRNNNNGHRAPEPRERIDVPIQRL